MAPDMRDFVTTHFGPAVALRTIATAVLVVGLSCGSVNDSAAAEDPGAFVQSLGNEVVAILKSGDITRDQRRSRFRHLFTSFFDVPAMARIVASRYWRKMSDPQRQEYLELFREYVANIYAVQFSVYTGETFEVMRQQQLDGDATMVKARILRTSGRPLPVDFRVAVAGEELKITDVVVEAVSLLITKRSEFKSVFRQKGVDGFLQTLRERVAAPSQ